MKARHLATATLAVIALAGAAKADLTGTELDLTVEHTGHAGAIVGPMGGIHEFGTTDVYANGFFGQWSVTSSFDSPVSRNKLVLDFTLFNYVGFTGEVGTITVENLQQAVLEDSIKIESGGNLIGVNIIETHNGFIASWRVDDVLPNITDQVQISWTSVPAPGALALLSLAGTVRRGRRRSL